MIEMAAFGAGCFWSVEYKFSKMPGVLRTSAGYMGGEESQDKVTYEQVCFGKTGHAEVVRIEYDTNIIKYEDLLDVFWELHDPTQLNKQGPDVGEQYRSIIFYYNNVQKEKAEKSRDKIQLELGEKKIVTQIVKAGKFYMAEEYHQKYLEKRGKDSCSI